jgi:TolA-binding protein
MHNNLSGLFDPFSHQSPSLYELLPLLILATLLCVTAAVIAFNLVSLFFRRERGKGQKRDIELVLNTGSGWRGRLLRLFFPGAAAEYQKLADEIRRLRTLGEASENEKKAQFEQNQKAQRRLSEMQREIEVLQGALTEKFTELEEESGKLQELSQHSKHLEKQLDEIVLELERIYHNAHEKPIEMPTAVAPAAPVAPDAPAPPFVPSPAPPPVNPPPTDEAGKLRALLLAYRQAVKEHRW